MFKPSFLLPLLHIGEFVRWDVFTVNPFPEADPPIECRPYLGATNEYRKRFYLVVLLYITLLWLCLWMEISNGLEDREVNHKFAMELAEATPEEREERLQMICRFNGSKVGRRENVGGEEGDMFPGN
jgi:hypothetical protein